MAEELIELGRICGRGKVRRSGYVRSGYTRKDGTHVAPTRVGPSCVPDKGAPGKTPSSKKWFPKGVKVPGWSKEDSASERRSGLKKLVSKKRMSCDLLARNMNAIANVTADQGTKQKMRSDRTWLKEEGPCKS